MEKNKHTVRHTHIDDGNKIKNTAYTYSLHTYRLDDNNNNLAYMFISTNKRKNRI